MIYSNEVISVQVSSTSLFNLLNLLSKKQSWSTVSSLKTAEQSREHNLSWDMNGGMLAVATNLSEVIVFEVE
jgi:hypothetical protein